MADTKSTAPNAHAQFRASGYILNEPAELALRESIIAMEHIARMFDLDGKGSHSSDITGDGIAAILRSFARLQESLIAPAQLTFGAKARARHNSEDSI